MEIPNWVDTKKVKFENIIPLTKQSLVNNYKGKRHEKTPWKEKHLMDKQRKK